MHRFFAPPEFCHGPEITLPESEAHHAESVLRVHLRDRVVVLNGAGTELLCEVTAHSRREVRLRVLQRHQAPPLRCAVTLLQAVPKPKAMDLIVQKATELGAARIVPLQSERTVAQWEPGTAAAKVARWRTTAIEAAKQCGTPWLPVIETPLAIHQFLQRGDRFDLNLIASLQPQARHPRHYFQQFLAEKQHPPASLALWVGPEGDFTPAEINAARSAGALPITLGPLVLRSETAAIYCLAVASYELQVEA